MAVSLKVLIENFAESESIEAIDALPASHAPIKELLRAAQNGNEALIQPLYTKIFESSLPEVLALTLRPYTLLSTLLAVAIAHDNISITNRLLTISPPPRLNLRRFLSQPGTPFSAKITASQNPEIRSLMLKHGYQKTDEVAFDQGLYDAVLGKEENCLDTISTMLENGAQPRMDHLRVALKLKPISVLELLLRHYPAQELKDCRLLHDAVQAGKAGRVLYLLDVVRMNINLFPTERERLEPESGIHNPDGVRISGPNGTPLHEAVRYNRKHILETLIKKGARTDIKDEDGQTPYEVAKKKKAKDTMALFPEHAKRASAVTFSGLRSFFSSSGRE